MEGSETSGFPLVEDAHVHSDLDLRDLFFWLRYCPLHVRMYNCVLEILHNPEVTHIEIFQIVVEL